MKKQLKTMAQLIIVAAAAVIFAGCDLASEETASASSLSASGTISKAAAGINTNVLLNRAYLGRSGRAGVPAWSADIIVKNIAYNKTVTLVYTIDDWKTTRTLAANYNFSIDNNYEVWSASGSFNLDAQIDFLKFAVSYTVNGNTYWDNNNSKNYSLVYFQDLRPNIVVGATNVWVQSGPFFWGKLVIKNLDYGKVVTISYHTSDDIFKKYQVNAHYVSTNSDGTENWEFQSSEGIHYGISYIGFDVEYQVLGIKLELNNNFLPIN